MNDTRACNGARYTRRTMTAPAESVSRSSNPSRVAAITVWILVQLAALALGASGAPLWARFDRPTEDLALPVMLAAQIAAAALLAPLLLRDVTRAILVIVSAIPFAHLASALSGGSIIGLVRSELFVAGWIALLAMWTIALPRHRNLVAAVASAVSIGGVVLAYLHNEYGRESGGTTAFPPSPILSAIRLTDESVPLLPTLATMAILLVSSAAIVVLITRRSNPTSYPQSDRAKM